MTKTPLPKQIVDSWKKIIDLNDRRELLDERLYDLEHEPMAHNKYLQLKEELEIDLRYHEDEWLEAMDDLFVDVNNYIVEEE